MAENEVQGESTLPKSKVNLDIFWLRDDSLEETANLSEPDVLAVEFVDDLEAALEQFRAIAEDLGEEGEPARFLPEQAGRIIPEC